MKSSLTSAALRLISAMSSAGRILSPNVSIKRLVSLSCWTRLCQEGVGLVRVFMEVAKRNRELVHAADELARSNSVTVITDECDLHEVFENDPPEEIDKLVRGAFHHFHSCEHKVQFTDEIAHHFVPQGMPLIEIAAFVRESVKREVVR